MKEKLKSQGRNSLTQSLHLPLRETGMHLTYCTREVRFIQISLKRGCDGIGTRLYLVFGHSMQLSSGI